MVRPRCIICGSEACRLVLNEPLCSACNPSRNGAVILRERMYAAKKEYWRLLDRAERLNSEIVKRSHGIPYLDSVQAIENIGQRTRLAFDKYQKALRLYFGATAPKY
jgi:hypothetical protein